MCTEKLGHKKTVYFLRADKFYIGLLGVSNDRFWMKVKSILTVSMPLAWSHGHQAFGILTFLWHGCHGSGRAIIGIVGHFFLTI